MPQPLFSKYKKLTYVMRVTFGILSVERQAIVFCSGGPAEPHAERSPPDLVPMAPQQISVI